MLAPGTSVYSLMRMTYERRLQDFVHEATQIDKLTNSEQNRHLQTINSKQIKLQRVTILISM